MSDVEVLYFISAKMFFAVVCGAVVGLERELNHATAGFKTQILICVGAMLFAILPQVSGGLNLSTETGRVIAQIVSGVGFLGAGAIIRGNDNQVVGLTTAACIWFTAAIGIMIGLEHGLAATFTTVSLMIVLTIARKLERRYIRKDRTRTTDKSEVRHLKKTA
jgi:putative Mg2+ transporter-C (MgtC) family protein